MCQHTSSSAGLFGDGGGGAGERREHTQVTDAMHIYGKESEMLIWNSGQGYISTHKAHPHIYNMLIHTHT